MSDVEQVTAAVTAMYAALDDMKFDAATSMFSSDPQAVDEVSRRWLRSSSDIESYLRDLARTVESVSTRVRDMVVKQWDDTALVTCWVDQDYTISGRAASVSAPTTLLLRREDGSWQLALVHSIPLPDEETPPGD